MELSSLAAIMSLLVIGTAQSSPPPPYLQHPVRETLPEVQYIDDMTVPEMIQHLGEREGLQQWEIDKLSRIAYCESRYDPYASNPNSTAKGVFQFLNSSWAAWGEGDVYDPQANIRAAIKYYKHSGFRPWVCQ